MTKRNNEIKRKRSLSKEKEVYNDLLKKMDKSVLASFSPVQLKAIQNAINIRQWRKHSVDIRPTLALPFIPWNFYIVFLVGLNRRQLSSNEKIMASAMFLFVFFIMGMTLFGFILIMLYLIKSWLGIDIFPNNSLGIWDEFKRLFD
jgi:hypothetical protein